MDYFIDNSDHSGAPKWIFICDKGHSSEAFKTKIVRKTLFGSRFRIKAHSYLCAPR